MFISSFVSKRYKHVDTIPLFIRLSVYMSICLYKTRVKEGYGSEVPGSSDTDPCLVAPAYFVLRAVMTFLALTSLLRGEKTD